MFFSLAFILVRIFLSFAFVFVMVFPYDFPFGAFFCISQSLVGSFSFLPIRFGHHEVEGILADFKRVKVRRENSMHNLALMYWCLMRVEDAGKP